MGRIALVAVLWALAVAGLVIVMAPGWIDRAAHWELFVSRLDFYIPGLAMLLGGAIGLAILEDRR